MIDSLNIADGHVPHYGSECVEFDRRGKTTWDTGGGMTYHSGSLGVGLYDAKGYWTAAKVSHIGYNGEGLEDGATLAHPDACSELGANSNWLEMASLINIIAFVFQNQNALPQAFKFICWGELMAGYGRTPSAFSRGGSTPPFILLHTYADVHANLMTSSYSSGIPESIYAKRSVRRILLQKGHDQERSNRTKVQRKVGKQMHRYVHSIRSCVCFLLLLRHLVIRVDRGADGATSRLAMLHSTVAFMLTCAIPA